MTTNATAFPLAWPPGWPRTPPRERMEARFQSSRNSPKPEHGGRPERVAIRLTDARERLADQLDKLGGRYPVLSTNLELRLDGQPRANQPEPADTGAAVYFQLRDRPIVLACDRWNTVAGNVAAIAAHIKAMRDMDRWGVGNLEQMFTGYLALPAPLVVDDWRAVLGDLETLAQAEATYRRLMATAHPDAGGSHAQAAALNAAIAEARRVLR